MNLHPSKSHRWLICTASPAIENLLPDSPPSIYATEGTEAHKLAEITLSKKSKVVEHESKEMVSCVQQYIDYIYKKSKFKNLLVENKFKITDSIQGTVDCAFVKKSTLYIVDYKHGAGIDVDVNENPQLLLYALGLLTNDIVPKFKKIKLVIIQPRTTGIKEFKLTLKQLLKFEKKVLRAIYQIENQPELVVGEHCKWCKAESICIARHKLFMQALEQRNLITPMQFKQVLDLKEDVISYLKAVETKAYSLFADGKKIPGYKIVNNRESTKWNKEEDIIIRKLEKAGFKEITTKKLKTITELKKTIPEKIIRKHIIKKSSGITLVKESDTRQAVSDAERDFSDGNK